MTETMVERMGEAIAAEAKAWRLGGGSSGYMAIRQPPPIALADFVPGPAAYEVDLEIRHIPLGNDFVAAKRLLAIAVSETQARVAILAMREPTKAMVKAIAGAMVASIIADDSGEDTSTATLGWQAGIDEAAK